MAKTRPARYDCNEVYIDGTDRKPRLENVDDRGPMRRSLRRCMDFKFRPYDFDVEITKFGGTAYIKAPALPPTPWHQLSRQS